MLLLANSIEVVRGLDCGCHVAAFAADSVQFVLPVAQVLSDNELVSGL